MRNFFIIACLIVGVILLAFLGFGYYAWQAAKGQPASELEAAYMSAEDRFVDIAGARVRVREEGPESAPVIILVHGFTYSLESYDAWAEDLSANYRVVRYDLLGHGLTGPDPEMRYAPAERAAFLGDVMDALDIDRASIAGSSLGGLIAWRFAADNPDRVDRLILIDAGAFSINGVTDTPVDPPAPLAACLRLATDPCIAATLGAIYVDPSRLPEHRAGEIQAMMQREGNGAAFLDHLAEFTLPDPTADLARVQAPTLIIWGAQDRVIAVDHADRLAAAIPDAQTAIFEGVGHAPHEEAPAETLQAVRAFLNE